MMTTVLFEGVKTFWKTKIAVHVAIVEHPEHNILEVAAFDETTKAEAPRVYLDAARIVPYLGQSAGMAVVCDSELSTPMAAFVFNRLCISLYLPISKALVVSVERGSSATEQEGEFDIVVSRPPDLVPYSRSNGPSSPAVSLSAKEKWRIPLILIRLMKGLPLRSKDATIFSKYSAHRTQTDLAEAVSRVLKVTVSSGHADRLDQIAHSIVPVPLTPLARRGGGVSRAKPHPQSSTEATCGRGAQANRSPPPSPMIPDAFAPASPATAFSPATSHALGGKNTRQQIRDMMRLPGAFVSSMSNPSSTATSLENSPVASRASSPRRLRAVRSASPQVSPLTQTEGVGFEGVIASSLQHKPGHSPGHSVPFLFGRRGHSPVPAPTIGQGSPADVQKPPRQASGTRSSTATLSLEDELLATTLTESSVDMYSPSPDTNSDIGSPLKTLKQRCRTFDLASNWLGSSPITVPEQSHGQGWSSGQELVRRIRSSSGDTLTAILGLSSAASRVVPAGPCGEGAAE